jgi:hypothetical protein
VDVISAFLDEMQLCVRTMDALHFTRTREKLEAALTDPLLRVFSLTEAAQILEEDVRLVRRWVEKGKLRGRKSGGIWLVRL